MSRDISAEPVILDTIDAAWRIDGGLARIEVDQSPARTVFGIGLPEERDRLAWTSGFLQ